MDEAGRARCAALAALLEAALVVSLASLLFDGVALLAMLLKPSPAPVMFIAVLLLGLAERWFAFRIRLDRHLFDALADGRSIASLDALDDALQALGLRARGAPPRGLDERIAGTRRLLVWLLAVVALQLAAFTGAWLT